MSRFPFRPCLLVLALLGGAVAPLRAQSGDSAAVLGVVQRLFDAMASRDTAAARTLLTPGARFTSIVRDTNAVARVQPDSEFLRWLGTAGPRVQERIWSPEVRVRGPVATVWAPYDFHVSGTFSHCGVDAFTLLREEGTWRVAAITYTVERAGCGPSRIGPRR